MAVVYLHNQSSLDETEATDMWVGPVLRGLRVEAGGQKKLFIF